MDAGTARPSDSNALPSDSAAIGAREYRTIPFETSGMPPGIPYIVGNEAAERFSFYGMKSILQVHMTNLLLPLSATAISAAAHDAASTQASAYYHQFVAAVYFFPILGSLLSDGWLGKYRTIMLLSIVYCIGHLAIAIDPRWIGLTVGLALISIGSGGIKPCVSAHVGDQFGRANQHLLERVFSWFYFAINFGSFFSYLLIPELNKSLGPHVAFGVPGLLMLLATLVFWSGRWKFAHIPPGGLGMVREAWSPEGRKIVAKVLGVFAFLPMFWALYDQHGSTWISQAGRMDLKLFGYEIQTSQIQAVNPLLILTFIPLFSYVVFPFIGRFVRLTYLRKIGAGLFLAGLSFAVVGMIEQRIAAGERPSVLWQIIPYVIMTAAEVLVSIVALEFSYTQAPRRMKSVVMALYLLSTTVGNQLASAANWFVLDSDGNRRVSETEYFMYFAGLMFLNAIAFVFYARTYREQSFIQDGADESSASTAPTTKAS